MSQPQGFPSWATAAMILGIFAIGSEALVISPLLKQLSSSLRVSEDIGGLGVSAYGLTLALSTPFAGVVSDLISRRFVIVCGLMLFAVATTLCAVAPSIEWLIVARAACGVMAGCAIPAIYAYVGDQVPYEQRGAVMGRVMSGWGLSLILGVPMGAAIGEFLGWRGTFVVVGVMAFIAGGVLTRLPETQIARADAASGRTSLAVFTDALHVRQVPALMLVNALMMGSFYGIYTYIGSYVQDALSMGSAGAGLCVVIYGVGYFTASANARIQDKLGKARTFQISICGLILALALLPYSALSFWTIAPLLLLWGLCQGTCSTSLHTIASERAVHLRGRILALMTCAGYLGLSAGSALMGQVKELHGLGAAGLLCSLGTIAAALVFALAQRDAAVERAA
jgi:MFS transporter, DHA1 family, inner membrane transport protein